MEKSDPAFFVARYFDPTSGAVKIDGQDLQSVKLKSFRKQLAVVPQVMLLPSSRAMRQAVCCTRAA